MSETDNRDPSELPSPMAARADAPDVDDGDDEGDEGPDEGEGSASPGQPAAPGPGGRRRRRRRRRRGAQVLFTPEGQAYRMVPGPDGQPQQVFLTPQELQQYQQRLAQQQQQGQQHHGQQAPQHAPQQHHGERQQRPPPVSAQPSLAPVEGVLDTEAKGPNAYLRQLKRNLLPSPDDAEIPKNLVQKLRLRPGQYLNAFAQMKGNKGIVQRVEQADGRPLDLMSRLPHFADLTSVDPSERIKLENGHREMVTRVLDLVSPIGKGQRALIVAPPKTGKTIMLQRIAQAVVANHPEIHLMVLLIDERPEEVTDMRRNIKAEVLASSSDRPTGDHLKIAELALERARRLVEGGKDVMILLDSITRLARAYNKEVDNSGRTLSGGVDSRALERPKRIFGAARATEEAGSLTIVGTALIDTGSRMDEVIFEEFKGTGNSEVTLDRFLAEKRIFPAVNIGQSGTRKEEKLFGHKEYEKVKKMRQMLFAVKPVEAMEALVKRLSRYTYNDEFLEEL
ncbi:transcription termination factor Rho [Cystobacter fuscus]|uniref:transcription termination factor Rho n=1 Tax=Cystobacter fuscus TaxID=43 RepID=UPI002B2D91BB|nr:transcription termination factor Rho [Cystobacter fuscus]